MNHEQTGDPATLAEVLLKLSESEQPPVRFAAGSDAYGFVLKKADSMRREAEQWRELSASTDRTGVKPTDLAAIFG
jgi:hypothetical protein